MITSAGLACWEDGGRQAGRVHTPRSYTGGGVGNAWIAAPAGGGHEAGMETPIPPRRRPYRTCLDPIDGAVTGAGQRRIVSFRRSARPVPGADLSETVLRALGTCSRSRRALVQERNICEESRWDAY